MECNVRGSRSDSKLYPFHTLCAIISEDVALQLPAAHSLTGCDTVSKVGTKHAALKALPSVHLENFGTSELTEEAIDHAEHFLVDILKPKSTVKTFDKLRELKYFDYKSDIDLTKLPCTSSTIRLHIAHGFYQCYRWIMAPKGDITITHPPQEYAYEAKGDCLEPILLNGPIKPDDLPEPCNCGKCARNNVCPCRIAGVPCCMYCKCKGKDICKNPNNI